MKPKIRVALLNDINQTPPHCQVTQYNKFRFIQQRLGNHYLLSLISRWSMKALIQNYRRL